MIIQDRAIILSASRFGEKSLILKILSEKHGVISGLVRSQKNNALYMQGNLVSFTWNARLEEHLGNLQISLEKSYSTLFYGDYTKILAISALASLVLEIFPEREKVEYIFNQKLQFLENLKTENWLMEYSKIGLEILKNAGFGFDFERCSVSGVEDIYYISPKTGACVSQIVGEPYKDKLFKIPEFFKETQQKYNIKPSEILDGLDITRYFLERHIFSEKGKQTPFAYEEFYNVVKKNSNEQQKYQRQER